jgi:succinate dehydrogenase/fumarate reductase flavoprotein subunit
MSRPILELEAVLESMIAEHRKLLSHMDAQQAAMKAMDVRKIDDLLGLQEAGRSRIMALEARRQALVRQAAMQYQMTGEVTLKRLADHVPRENARLLRLREELKDLVLRVQHRTTVVGKVAQAVCGHLNTALRILAKAVERSGVYTRGGVPRVASRIGVMDAVG